MRSFGLVDEKLAEADFFLDKLAETRSHFEAGCYFNAFASAARSVTFALQASLTGHPKFDAWYGEKQETLKADPFARFFHRARTDSQHLGVSQVRGGSSVDGPDGGWRPLFWFQGLFDESGRNAPTEDVVTSCRRHMTNLALLIFECYDVFGPIIDPDQYYTVENIRRLGKSVEDCEEDLGYSRGYTDLGDGNEAERLKLLWYGQPKTMIDDYFHKYLGKDRYEILARAGNPYLHPDAGPGQPAE